MPPQNTPPWRKNSFALKAIEKQLTQKVTLISHFLLVSAKKKHSCHQRWGVEAEKNLHKQFVKNKSYLPLLLHAFLLLSHNCYTFFTLLFKHLGFATSLSLDFPMGALTYMQKSICFSPANLSYASLILRSSWWH